MRPPLLIGMADYSTAFPRSPEVTISEIRSLVLSLTLYGDVVKGSVSGDVCGHPSWGPAQVSGKLVGHVVFITVALGPRENQMAEAALVKASKGLYWRTTTALYRNYDITPDAMLPTF